MTRCWILAGWMLSVGCGSTVEPAGPAAEPRPTEVRVARARLESRPSRTPVVGTVAARRAVEVAARIAAGIKTVAVEEGDRVRAGQRLIELDDRDLRAAAEAAAAALGEADEAIRAAEHRVEAARANAELARITQERFEGLVAKESASKQEYDRSSAEARAAAAELAAAEAGMRRAAASRVRVEAQLTAARVALSHAVIDSPTAGVVTARLQDPGSLATPGKALLEIEETAAYRLEVAVPESAAAAARVGGRLPLEIDALGATGPAEGTIVEISPALDPSTRTFLVKIALPDHPAIRSGQYGRAFLAGAERRAITVPSEAVVERGQLASVFVVENGAARRRLVTLGERRADEVEILSGVEAGELIALNPGELSDGAPATSVEEDGR